MKHLLGTDRVLAIGLLLLLCIDSVAQTQSYPIVGKVVHVTDGDTVKILDLEEQTWKIRLNGIDAPESGQDFGVESTDHLSELVLDKLVVAFCEKKDRYQRHVCWINVNGIDANLDQVTNGFAWHYKDYQDDQSEEQRLSYALAEDKAKKHKVGLWSSDSPIAPWDWRRLRRR